ncbi:tetratricopeptide repeat protein [candidate division WOR-3 bacterium]|nr:tetratricopeptide repeat protein [candidate division WOR-3 bacterium]
MNSSRKTEDLVHHHLKEAKSNCRSDPDKTLMHALEALKLSLKKPAGVEKITALNLVGMGLALKLEYLKALKCFKKALEENDKHGDRKRSCSICNNIGLALVDSFKYEEAFVYFEKARETAHEMGLKKQLAIVYQNIARLFLVSGDYDQAIQFLFKGLDQAENDFALVAEIRVSIGELYFRMKDWKKALEFHSAALDVFERTGDAIGTAGQYNNLALVFEAQGKERQAIEHLQKALEMAEEIKHLEFISIMTTNMARLYSKTGDDENEKMFLERTLRENEELNNTENLAVIHRSFGDYYLKTGDLTKALDSYSLSREMSMMVRNKSTLMDSEKSLADYYSAVEDFGMAYIHLDKYMSLKSELFQEKITEKVRETQVRFLVERKQKDIEQAKAEANFFEQKNKELESARHKFETEKAKSDSLVLSILPSVVAYELKEKGEFKPRIYDEVTVCMIEFPELAKLLKKEDFSSVLEELNGIYSVFDMKFDLMNCEKIKTFENKYIAVSGMPLPDENHTFNMVRVAVENARYMKDRAQRGGFNWAVKAGIHSGKVIGGIVGKRKYLYDIFGDTVNKAARILEASGPDRISLSETAFFRVKNNVKSFEVAEKSLKGIGRTKIYSFSESDWYE